MSFALHYFYQPLWALLQYGPRWLYILIGQYSMNGADG